MAEPWATPTANPPPERIMVDSSADEVCCDGGGGALGHPLVWYSFDGQSQVTCGYCDREFIKTRAGAGSAAS